MKKAVLLIIFFLIVPCAVFAGDYVIGDGDSLDISVWGSPELSISIKVRPDGKISLPALGEVKASGLTAMELTALLEKELVKIVKTPIVTVIITEMTNYRVLVFGRGAETGIEILSRETTLLEFLSMQGSLKNADLQSSYLVRGKKRIKTGFYELFEKGDFSQDIVLEPNDILFIPDNYEKRIRIVGEIHTPTSIQFREGLTILDVILEVGGFTEFAKENNVKLLRKKEGKEREEIVIRAKDLMKGDLSKNLQIMPGDVIVVKESIF